MAQLAPWIKRTDARHPCADAGDDDIKDELFLRDLVRHSAGGAAQAIVPLRRRAG